MTAAALRLNQRYRLSPAEAEVALAISLGRNLTAIAVARQTSIQTVRSQLKVIFRKTGVTSQAQLVALVLR
jgi:DNA-binding CsgD family transcriptional regulator